MKVSLTGQIQAKPKVSLTGQIQEVEYELAQRARVYPSLVRKGTYRQAEADLHVQRMEAVKRTLEWFQQEEDYIRWAIANRDAIKQRMEG